MKIGYYSDKAAQQFGHCVYLDKVGLKVNVSAVSEIGEPCPLLWDDTYCVGEVGKFVCSCWKENLKGRKYEQQSNSTCGL
jgi:hypothetical protein